MTITGPILEILDLARWAPSGDNTQPWRFEIVDGQNFVIHGFDTRDHVVYDLDGRASQLAIGCLMETISIAASGQGLRAEFTRRLDVSDRHPTIDVKLIPADIQADALISAIQRRTVQRRPMSTRPLTPEQKLRLEQALPTGFSIRWFQSFAERLRMANLMFANSKLRLTIPEAYVVHRSIIDWGKRFSEDKVPDQAVGLDPVTLKLMRWVMVSWQRVSFFNRWLAGTLAPRIQLDLLPGVACAAHFAIIADQEPKTIDDYLAAGRAVQRHWLMATQEGLHIQPELTPLIFSRYVRDNRQFSAVSHATPTAVKLSSRLENQLGQIDVRRTVFMGRIGVSLPPKARSIRLPLKDLISFLKNK